jgi:hypothetical protein
MFILCKSVIGFVNFTVSPINKTVLLEHSHDVVMFIVNIFYILVYFNKIQNRLITLKDTLINFNHILPASGIAHGYSTEKHCSKEMVFYIFTYVCGNLTCHGNWVK